MRQEPAGMATWLNAWQLVWTSTLTVAGIAAIILIRQTDLVGVRSVIAMSARTSLVLFCLAFSGSSVHRLWPGRWSRWQLRNRRYLGLSFAASHTIHIAALIVFGVVAPAVYATVGTWTNGMLAGLAYVFLLAMAATSFDRTAAWLGAARWRALHLVGSYYIWLIFLIAFGKRMMRHPVSFYPVAVAILVLSLAIRLVAGRYARRRTRAQSLPQTLPSDAVEPRLSRET
ncbi:hypothetical protein [Paraburkholderia phenazinium]|jgi:sulfoxide reductase heme-binding subunit YedZ|uniref:DMSO/TMAO reductase YedYZ, heme-binding membrane subunit n=1 Tax=Paraburkholderia phenazinium TaxID=60549 RepID=A0A1N6GP90_9BURK|nr:hypothetical protein [Paraburkholderia phenazinium]SIO09360.1 hypothetical protein SAMN05444165_0886 [Paraburkholderia phenazinium]